MIFLFFFTIMVYLLLLFNVSKYKIWFWMSVRNANVLWWGCIFGRLQAYRHICSRHKWIMFDFQPHYYVQVLFDFLFLSQVDMVTYFFSTVFLICFLSFLKAKYLYSGIHINIINRLLWLNKLHEWISKLKHLI